MFNEIIMFQDNAQMRQSQEMRMKVQRAFHILRGLFAGATTHKSFGLLFDWFYPTNFEIVKKCLVVYCEDPCDDDILLLILRFLRGLVDNSSGRLRFDTWSINGLIVYKETASLMIQIMEKFGCLSAQGKPLRANDQYKEVFRYLKVLMAMLGKCISGNYINFAICEYYNDNTFTQLSQMIMQCILNQDLDLIKSYKPLYKQLYTLLEDFFNKHLELIFLRFDN